ncbi:MAG: class I SAM-dependent methyltransferase [Methanomicrobia archaeon]|nr:class I SAM-dependent methyltransferase [Methanomicrobia archaeon]
MKPIDCEDLYSDGRHYDCQTKYLVEDIPFHLRQIKKYGGPVLELACGTGRITIPMAEKGIEITGLDVSETMLSHARKKAAKKGVNVEWIKADCRNFKLNKKFNLIFFPFNSITHLHDLKSLEACFSCVKEHLTHKGRFVIDVFNPHLDILMRDPSRRYQISQYSDPDGKGTVIITENNIYDTATQINRIKWYYSIGKEKDKFVVENNMRILFPQELDALLLYNGFTIETKFGNYDETPFDSASPKQLVVCYPK